MDGTTSLSQAIAWTLWFSSELAFKWLPGTAVALFGGAPGTGVSGAEMPLITSPITAPQVADFLRDSSAPGVYDNLFYYWTILVGASVALSLILATILIYSLIRILQIRRAEYRHFESYSHTVASGDVPKTKLRWDKVRENAYSENPQNWRLAILESDIMLGELLDSLGYKGETMADKMRGVEKEKFNTIDLAWEAHRFRNRIAHETSTESISPAEVRRMIGNYEKVFREFKFVE